MRFKEAGAATLALAYRLRRLLFGLLSILFGLLIGYSAMLSRAMLEATSSAFLIGLFALIAIQYPIAALLAWLFLNTFIDSWVEIELGAGIPDLSFGRVAVASMLASLLMRVSTGRIKLVRLNITDLFAVATPVAIALAAPLSTDPIHTLQAAISFYFVPLAAFLLTKQLVRDQEKFNWLLGVIAFFGAFAGAYAIYEALTGNILFLEKGQQISRMVRGQTNMRLIVGLVGETGAMGRLLATTLLVTTYIIMESKNVHFKPFWVMGALFQFGGLLATFSRTPLLTFIFGLFILQFTYPALRRILAALLIVVAVTLGTNWQTIQQTEVAQDRLSGIESANGRTTRWEAGMLMWRDRPLRGWGFGQFESMSGRYRTDGRTANMLAVENDYILLLVSTGLLGFLPYVLFLLTPFVDSIRLFRRRKQLETEPDAFIHAGTITLYWAIFACFVLSSFTAVNAQVVSRLIPFALMGGIIGTHQPLLAQAARRTVRAHATSTFAPAPRG